MTLLTFRCIFSVERDERYVLPMIKEILEINPDLYIFASPWSPPYWMKTGGSMCGGYMRDAYLDCYADYIISILVENPNGKKIAFIVNPGDAGIQAQIEIGGVLWYLELLADSVSTLIIED